MGLMFKINNLRLISSTQNKEIKDLIALQNKAKERKIRHSFCVEGKREIKLAHKGGYTLTKLFWCKDLFSESTFSLWNEYLPNTCEIIEVTTNVYARISYRSSTEGLLGIFKQNDLSINTLAVVNDTPLFLVAEGIEKPGNIGAILRTADAAGVTAVLLASPKTDLYNPNVIRSSVGGVFTVPIGTGTNTEVLDFLKTHNSIIYAAYLEGSVPHHDVNFKSSSAIVVGTESKGLSSFWTKNCSQNIKIPMLGVVDSMNVSVATGILLFEAIRQRLK